MFIKSAKPFSQTTRREKERGRGEGRSRRTRKGGDLTSKDVVERVREMRNDRPVRRAFGEEFHESSEDDAKTIKETRSLLLHESQVHAGDALHRGGLDDGLKRVVDLDDLHDGLKDERIVEEATRLGLVEKVGVGLLELFDRVELINSRTAAKCDE